MKTIEELEKEILEAKKEILKEIEDIRRESRFSEMAFFTFMGCVAALLLLLLTSI